MDIDYYAGDINVVVWFEPSELEVAVDTLREFLDEAREMQLHIPIYTEDYFKKLESATTKKGLVFNFAYLEFGMNFLEKAFVIVPKEDSEVAVMGAKIRRLWVDIAPYFVMDSTLH